MKFTELDLHPLVQKELEKLQFTDCTPIQSDSIPLILAGKDVAGLAQTGTGKTAAFLLPLMSRILATRESQSVEGGQLESRSSANDIKRDDPILSEQSDEDPLSRDHVEAAEGTPATQGSDISQGRGRLPFPSWKRGHFILVLVPTRELAEQVFENVVKFGAATGLRGASIYGGTSYDKQKQALRDGAEFIIATPGRLIDLYKSHLVDLKQVQAVVFDEADRMFDMGFKDDMKYILHRIPRSRQFLVFSATLNFDVLTVAYEFGSHPIEVNVSLDQAKADNVKDEILHVGADERPGFLLSVLKLYKPSQAIIFTNFKFNVPRVADFLSLNGIPAMGISSLLTQAQRNRVLSRFKAENEQNILVATDVAARGLDIKGVDMVINFELPDDAENYVHRIGRTGRAGAEGRAISLVSERDVQSLQRIEDYLKHKIVIGWIEDEHLIKDYVAFPRESSRGPKAPRVATGQRWGDGPRRDGSDRNKNRDDRSRGQRGSRRTSGRPSGDKYSRGKNETESRDIQRTSDANKVHRDRRTGRHSGQEAREGRRDENFNARRRPQRKSHTPHQERYRSKKPDGHVEASQRRSRRSTSDLPKSVGIGGRLARFFKNLFS